MTPPRRPLEVNLIVRDNGLGLTRDAQLMAHALKANGCHVHVTPLGEQDEQQRWRHGRGRRVLFSHWQHAWARLRGNARYDVNIMFEHVWPLHLPLARCNVALPNPEWFDTKDARHLRRVDHVWAKTHHAEKIFQALGCTTSFVGFDGHDCHDPHLPRVRRFFHLAGGSRIKGTERLLALWQKHPEWPLLTVLQNPACARAATTHANIQHCIDYVTPAALQALQNTHLFHLCPSEAEGWGHYIVEGMAVGAMVITVDAAPMNELVSPERGLLVDCHEAGSMGNSAVWHFDDAAMERAVVQAMQMSDQALDEKRTRARAWFEQNQLEFPRRVGLALARIGHR